MDESFLHYIWKFLKFNVKNLKTTENLPLTILDPGGHNLDSGPDFEQARIKIDSIEWAGHVEIHVQSSDWEKHKHHLDKTYDNVVSHVVWENDKQVHIHSEPIPTLELKGRIEQSSIRDYNNFISTNKEIVCSDSLNLISKMTFNSMLDRVAVERLEKKGKRILKILSTNHNDWEATTYICLAQNFGFSTNKDSFRRLVESLPFQVISKYFGSIRSLEALLFGQAGFLEDPKDSYQDALHKEYQFLKSKHQLESKLQRSNWKFSKIRPSNFPTVRLAQFASILSTRDHLFSKLITISNAKDLSNLFRTSPSDYWKTHYDFGKKIERRPVKIGNSSIDNVMINTIAPLLAAYRTYSGTQEYLDLAISILEHTKPESNRITKKWERTDQQPQHAFDSQALIELYTSYCSHKKCLNCNVGIEILSK